MIDIWSAAIGAIGSAPVTAAVTYLARRYFEKHAYREAQERDKENIEIASRLIDVHKKACDANFNIAIPIESFAAIPTDGEEDNEQEDDAVMGMANAVLVNKVFECLTLERVAIEHPDSHIYLETAQATFVEAYQELSLALPWQQSPAMSQLINSYHAVLSSGSEADKSAVSQAWENLMREYGELPAPNTTQQSLPASAPAPAPARHLIAVMIIRLSAISIL